MTVPQPQPFSTVEIGAVFSRDLIHYEEKISGTQSIDLQSAVVGNVDPAALVTVFPAARLVLG